MGRDQRDGARPVAKLSRECSCTEAEAAAWLNDLAEAALSGDKMASKLLIAAVIHFLLVVKNA